MPDGSILASASISFLSPAQGDGGDRHLLSLGEKFERAYAEELAAWAASRDLGDEHPLTQKADALNDATFDIVQSIDACPVATVAGAMVKMRAVHWCRGGQIVDEEAWGYPTRPAGGFTTDLRLMTSALNVLLAVGAAR